MGKTKRTPDTIYLDPDKHEALVALAGRTRIPRAVLLREAVDDLLVKHKAIKKRRTSKP